MKCKNLRGPWQEVQIDAHSWQEIDTPAFWAFVDRAIAGFQKFTERIGTKPEDVMPWKVLGQKWHLSRKGFPPGKKTAWKPEVLEELLEMLSEAVPGGQFLWNNQNVVYLMVARRPQAVGDCVYEAADGDRCRPQRTQRRSSNWAASPNSARIVPSPPTAEDHDQVKLRFVYDRRTAQRKRRRVFPRAFGITDNTTTACGLAPPLLSHVRTD